MQRKPGPGEAEQQEQLTSYIEQWHLQRPGGQRWFWEPHDPLRAFPELMVLCGSQQSPAAHGLGRARIQPTSRRCVEGKDRVSPAAMAKPLVPPAQLTQDQALASHMGPHTEDTEHSQKNGMRISAGLGNTTVGKMHCESLSPFPRRDGNPSERTWSSVMPLGVCPALVQTRTKSTRKQ